jgi:HSP20 family protein
MSLIVRKPSVRRSTVPSTFDQVFNNFFNGGLDEFFGNDHLQRHPSVNIMEHEDRFEIELAAPGLDKGDFDVKVEQDHLLISAQKETKEETEEKGRYTRREFSYSSFKRSFQLPENVDAEAIDAKYLNGVLRVVLPKVKVEETSRVIEIK